MLMSKQLHNLIAERKRIAVTITGSLQTLKCDWYSLVFIVTGLNHCMVLQSWD